MPELIDTLSPEVVGNELLKADVVTSLRGLRLEVIPRNPERRDYLTRATFRLRSGKHGLSSNRGHGLG
jgi:hypothetical protein